MLNDVLFSWKNAGGEDPWLHLRVEEAHGVEEISQLYRWDLHLIRTPEAPPISVASLIDQPAALAFFTNTFPSNRLIHGIITGAEEVEQEDQGYFFRVTMEPFLMRASLMRKSVIYLEKTIRQIVDQVLSRKLGGLGLDQTSHRDEVGESDLAGIKLGKSGYAWRLQDTRRVDDPLVLPYCVQYQETDFDFLNRILENEGISYHFEHTDAECILVLCDHDLGRRRIPSNHPLGTKLEARELKKLRQINHLRPSSVRLSDYNWKNPNLNLIATSSQQTPLEFSEIPGSYEHSQETGRVLSEKRIQRFDNERQLFQAIGDCRLLSAGTIFALEYSTPKFDNNYLVTRISHSLKNTYHHQIEFVKAASESNGQESNFRPIRRTPKPRISGSQTAIVTAEPNLPQEINVGGPLDQGCVRVRFHWDIFLPREQEPSSNWIRVSQVFAGASHGAIWNPRVGNEVIVEFLEGDPDRPIITGRVYNGLNPPPENISAKPTFSCLKSMTSPADGNFNMLSFEDQQGKEEIYLHAARDHNQLVKHNASRQVGVDDSTNVGGSQSISVAGSQSTGAGSISMSSGSFVTVSASSYMSADAGSTMSLFAGTSIEQASTAIGIRANTIEVEAQSSLKASGGSLVDISSGSVMNVSSGGNLNISSPWIDISGSAKIRSFSAVHEIHGPLIILRSSTMKISGNTVDIDGAGTTNVNGGTVNVNGGTVKIKGGSITIEGGTVTVKGGEIKLN
jgi:type VI secretion system secreted protein VgrG